MPIYDFLCRDCESRFDDLVSAGAVDTVSCDQCGSADVVRQYAPFAVHAGGGGGDAMPIGGCMPGPAGAGGGGGCCGGGCGGCG